MIIRLRRGKIAVAALLALAGCSLTEPKLQETRELALPVEPDGRLAVDAGAGSLSVQGQAQATAVEVTAKIYQTRPNDDYTLRLVAANEGGARLESHTGSSTAGGNDRIDLTIRVPESMRLGIDDGSGSIRVERLKGNLEIADGSGSIRLSDIDADVAIDDGSGSIQAGEITGTVRIGDGSGSITITSADGDVTITDGSGSITVSNVTGVVTISDGSGSITVDGAQDFELLEDGGGSVSLDNIRNRHPSRD